MTYNISDLIINNNISYIGFYKILSIITLTTSLSIDGYNQFNFRIHKSFMGNLVGERNGHVAPMATPANMCCLLLGV